MRAARQHLDIVSDPEVNAYLDSLGYLLAANSDAQSQQFGFFLVDDPSINAFAAPGGYIGVHSGLILATESESELAAVMAHEIAHVTQHHMARTYEAAGKLNLPAATAVLLAVLLGSQNSQMGQAALAAATAGSAQYQINFTRANEQEADRIGIQTLARAGFDPRSMPTFFERLQRSSRYYGDTLPEFLSTHPVTVSRISDSLARAERYPHGQIQDSLAFHLAKAKVRVLTSKDVEQESKLFAARLKEHNDAHPAADHYGHALALVGLGMFDEARTELKNLLDKDPDRMAFRIALAQLEVASKHVQRGLELYRDALLLYPDNHALTMYYADALLQAGRAKEANEVLEEHLRKVTPDPPLYALTARAAGEAGHTVEAHQYLAEYYYTTGDTDSAIQQLELARNTPRLEDYQAARISARLHQIKQQALDEGESH